MLNEILCILFVVIVFSIGFVLGSVWKSLMK